MCRFSLPSKLKSFIDALGVTYNREREKAILTVDADDLRLKNYLGVYFPRSYGQIRQIYSALFAVEELAAKISNESSINVLCFGIGTGGDAAGLIDSIVASKTNVKKINLFGIDGNSCALKYAQKIIRKLQQIDAIEINFHAIHYRLNDEKDFNTIVEWLSETYPALRFDFIQTHKACGELLSGCQILNPYYKFAKSMSPLLKPYGLLLIADVAISSANKKYWYPEEMNKDLNKFEQENHSFKTVLPLACNCYAKECHSPCYSSTRLNNESFCFRLIANASLLDGVTLSSDKVRYIISHKDGICRMSQKNIFSKPENGMGI